MNLIKRTANSDHYELATGVVQSHIYSADQYYRNDYTDDTEPWKPIDSAHFVETEVNGQMGKLYRRMPIEVFIPNNITGYVLRDKRTGAVKRVELAQVGQWDLTKIPDNDPRISVDYEISQFGVRLWKRIAAGGPKRFKWLVRDDGESDIRFREEPEAVHQRTRKRVKVRTIREMLERRYFSWVEEIDQDEVDLDTDFTAAISTYVYGQSRSYDTARATSLSFASGTFNLGQRYGFEAGYDAKRYTIHRGFLKFDTSSIDDTYTVNDAKLQMTVLTNYSDTDFDVEIVKQDWSSQDPIATANQQTVYENCLTGTVESNIWRNTLGVAVNTAYQSGSLDTTRVSKTGTTYYSIISARDRGNLPPVGNEYLALCAYDHATTGYRPTLVVTSSAPPSAPEPPAETGVTQVIII